MVGIVSPFFILFFSDFFNKICEQPIMDHAAHKTNDNIVETLRIFLYV